MSINPAIKVGIIIVLALISLFMVIWFLQGYNFQKNAYWITVVFDDSMGLSEGSLVRMAGVTIGEVQDISLDRENRAVLKLRLNKIYNIPQGSKFTLGVGFLVGEKSVNIIPNRDAAAAVPHGSTVYGVQPMKIEDLLPQAQALMTELRDSVASVRKLLEDEEYQGRIKRILANLETATNNMNEAMVSIKGTVVDEQGGIHAIVSNVRIASESLRDLTAELENLAKDTEIQEDIKGTVTAARSATESLERMTVSMENLITEPKFQEDIRKTAAGAHKVVDKAQRVLDRFEKILPSGKAPKFGSSSSVPTRRTSLEILSSPGDGDIVPTISTTLSLKKDNFLRLGLYDVGITNKLIIQQGSPINSRTDIRYGIYASNLGLGIDYNFSPRIFGTVDVYDPENLRLDFKAGYALNDDWGLLFGVNDIFDDSQLTFGTRFVK